MRAASGDDVTESTEEIAASRPFESRVEVRIGADVTARRAGRFGELVIEGDGGVRVLGVPPALGTSDVRPDAVLEEAVERGMAERREVREVAGRRCRVYRLGSSASDGTLVPVGTTGGEHADVCVDERGLVLEEWWVQQGEPLRHRLAVEVDDDASFGEATFALDGELPPGPTDGGVEPFETDAGRLPPPPAGFSWLGQYEVTSAQVQQPTAGEVPPPRTTFVDVWLRGVDFLVLEHGPGELPPSPHGITVDVAGVGPAELILDLRANELRFPAIGDDAVRLYGTLAPDELLDVAASIGRPPS